MTAAILSIGTELTRGEIVNTNAQWLSAELTAIGFEVSEVSVVDDNPGRIVETLKRLASRYSVVVSTGGLGPTTDDLTAASVAEALSVPLVRHESSLEAIRRRFEALGRTMSESNAKQADFPRGADVLPNPVGTAPGFAVSLGACRFFFLPGVPREMKRLYADYIVPAMGKLAPKLTFQIRLKTFGSPESVVGEKLSGVEAQFPGVTLGYRATFPEIEVKVHATSTGFDEARMLADSAAKEVRLRLGDIVYGEGDDTFAEAVGRVLIGRGHRLAVAESCTGGLISHMITREPASEYFVAAAVTYANSAKTRILGVSEDVLRGHGAVSPEVAAAMAEGVRRVAAVEIGLSVTGIAGPTGATPNKPVGLVYWAVNHAGGTIVREQTFSGDRQQIQIRAAYAALALVRDVGLGKVS
jgi:nicotinamide-nucleotide amidase